MSGTHDRARDAILNLLNGLNGAPGVFQEQALEVYRDDIETLAEYLGVDKEE